jgi:transaldolase
MARTAYARQQSKFSSSAWRELAAIGAKRQRPLWASTGTKNPDYSDTMYVSELIGRDVINTMPEATLRAFADHGAAGAGIESATLEAWHVLEEAASAGLNLAAVTDQLERDGIHAFCRSYQEILEHVDAKVAQVPAPEPELAGRS